MAGAIAMIVLFFGIVGLCLWLGVVSNRKAAENVARIAAQLGLAFTPHKGFTRAASAEGTHRGRPLKVFSYTTGSGKSKQTWAALQARPLTPVSLTFRLQRQGFGTKLLGLFGAKEITVGDPAFDDHWFIQTNQPEFLQAALLPELRERIMAAVRSGAKGTFELKDGAVTYAELGSFYPRDTIDRFTRLADLVADLAILAEVAPTA